MAFKSFNGPTLYVDIDDSLVMWQYDPSLVDKTVLIEEYDGTPVRLLPHVRHIEVITTLHAAGHAVIFWSAGGSDWAEAVVKALGLTQYATAYLTKPSAFIDDLFPFEFMGERIYLDYNQPS